MGLTLREQSTYMIVVEGNIDEYLIARMGGMRVSRYQKNQVSHSTLTGTIADQSELNGVMNTLFNNRFTILSVQKLS